MSVTPNLYIMLIEPFSVTHPFIALSVDSVGERQKSVGVLPRYGYPA